MKAVRAYAGGDYRLEDVAIPTAGPGEVLLRVLGAGLCCSDTKMFLGSDFYWGKGGRVANVPVVPGHEFVGEVVQIGEPAPDVLFSPTLSNGQIVVVEQMITCRYCWFCKTGRENKCDRLQIYGQAVDGAMAEYVLVRRGTYIHEVPPNLATNGNAWKAFFAEPLAVSIHAVERAAAALALDNGEDTTTAVVSGCGPIGLGIIAALRRKYGSAVEIIAVDLHVNRLEVARNCGADSCVRPEVVLGDFEWTSRGGCDVYFEASGAPASVPQGIQVLRKRGTFVAVSVFVNGNLMSDWNVVSAGKELTIVGCSLGRECWPQALQMLAETDFPLDQVLTHRLGLGNLKTALALAMNPDAKANCIKVVLDPTLPLSESRLVSGSSMPSPTSPSMVALEDVIRKARSPMLMSEGSIRQNVAEGPNVVAHVNKAFSLCGSVVWVTGSSRGIGRAIAEHLSRLGAMVAVHGSSEASPSKLANSNESFAEKGFVASTMQELASGIASETGNETMAVVGDLCSETSVQMQVEQIERYFQRPIDALVCCAGGNIGCSGVEGDRAGVPVGDDAIFVSEGDARSVLDRNLLSSIICCQKVSPAMMASRRGRIVLIGSVAGSCGRAQGALYATAKAAQHQYTRCLAAQMRPYNVPVNCVAPGPSMTRRYVANLGSELDQNRVPTCSGDGDSSDGLQRYARPQDTADVVAFLLTDAAKYVSGQVIRVDGAAQLFPA